ncbi:carboxypeptidase-like regulatory domain-containing protein [Roseicitreum antarcticum]|uniref:Carboxypeptidase regulatory-like domain-containing protein n=1 Tax=Roseicitreum antarcticum TaxID=564137 RepID=A0A1H2TRX4_9RHOB|nr:carboxypeptidase-like regulatory domain-containing protein [Roseicitreum antarcticum]SDW46592.1 hypothetical protein SAMN04488238_102153 [Roseicitreum antarcticum]
MPHAAHIEAEVVPTIHLQARYDTGGPMAGAQVIIYAPDAPGDVWARGQTDDAGRFQFIPDALPGRWSVQVRQAGHGAMVYIETTAGGSELGDGGRGDAVPVSVGAGDSIAREVGADAARSDAVALIDAGSDEAVEAHSGSGNVMWDQTGAGILGAGQSAAWQPTTTQAATTQPIATQGGSGLFDADGAASVIITANPSGGWLQRGVMILLVAWGALGTVLFLRSRALHGAAPGRTLHGGGPDASA